MSKNLAWKRWDRPVIEKALSRMVSIDGPGLVQQARMAVNREGWVDMNGKAGKRLAELCAEEAPGEDPIWEGPNRNI
jgi:hypothetical protein